MENTTISLSLEQLRKNRSHDAVVARGNIPIVDFHDPYISEKIVVSTLLFAFSMFIAINTRMFLGLLLAPILICPYLFFPLFYVHYIYYKTKRKPSAEILDRFGDRYKSVKKFIIENNLVEAPIKPEEEIKNIQTNNYSESPFRLWLGVSTGQLVNLWHKAGMTQNQG